MKTLHAAARLGDAEAVRAILATGIPVDLPNKEACLTPLMVACRSPGAGIEILKILLDAGADPDAFVELEWNKSIDYSSVPCDPDGGGYPIHLEPLINEVMPEISRGKFQLLVDHGIDIHVRRRDGDTPFLNAAAWGRQDLMKILLAAGADPGRITAGGGSAIGGLASSGRFRELAWLLEQGVDPAPLEWTALHRAVAIGNIEEVADLIVQGADLEARDRRGHTAFLLAVYAGDCDKAALLLEKGANRHVRGNREGPAQYYAILNDQPQMLQWLLDWGFDPAEADESDDAPLKLALKYDAEHCFCILLEFENRKVPSLDFYDELMKEASSSGIVALLVERGANPALARREAVHRFIHLESVNDLEVTQEEFDTCRLHRFGTANPERVDNPFWNAMVRCGWDAYIASRYFNEDRHHRKGPVWSQHRNGMSLTPLPDGRFIQIGGEVGEDPDIDFCIYNDVIIHDGRGSFEILAYPREIFPPTDHHSATLVGKWIYIIGNYGEIEDRDRRTTVYRFHTESQVIEKVLTAGRAPGWISSHHAVLEKGRIRVFGGKILLQRSDGFESLADHTGEYTFSLASNYWDWSNWRQTGTPET